MKYVKWTKEKIIEELVYYQDNNYTAKELRRENSSLCAASYRFGIPHFLLSHKKSKREPTPRIQIEWTKEKITEDLKYYQENDYSTSWTFIKTKR